MMLPRYKFGNPYQTATASTNTSTIIFSLNIPEGSVGFIDKVGNNWLAKTGLLWQVDGEYVESGTIQRQIATVQEPQKLNPPIVFKRNITWTGINNSTADYTFEVFNDGYFVMESDMKNPKYSPDS